MGFRLLIQTGGETLVRKYQKRSSVWEDMTAVVQVALQPVAVAL
jgi:hypothetical protein